MKSISSILLEAVGNRSTMTTPELAGVLETYGRCGGDLLHSITPKNPVTDEIRQAAETWAEMVKGITCVSVFFLRQGGYVRYDEPGRLDPTQQCEVTFVPAGMRPESIRHMRRHCSRLVVVNP